MAATITNRLVAQTIPTTCRDVMVSVLAADKWRETTIICTKAPMYHGPEHYLDSDGTSGRFMAHARVVLKLAKRFEMLAPAMLSQHARVVNYRSGIVVIHAENGAVAVKLRQISRRLCSELSKEGYECSDMEVKVQPRSDERPASCATLKPISSRGAASLQATRDSLPEGTLRQALDRLLASALIKE